MTNTEDFINKFQEFSQASLAVTYSWDLLTEQDRDALHIDSPHGENCSQCREVNQLCAESFPASFDEWSLGLIILGNIFSEGAK